MTLSPWHDYALAERQLAQVTKVVDQLFPE